MGRTVVFSRAARALGRLPGNVEALIREKLDPLAAEPHALTDNVAALRG